MLEAKGIKKSYNKVKVLKGIDLSINKGEIVSVIGSSGAGKSTLLHILGTLDKADEGIIKFKDQDITRLKDKDLARFRNQQLGFVFQFHNLFPEFTALENICIPAYIAGGNEKEAEVKAMKLMDLLHITHRAHHKPSQMSGGEQQRTAVARALINSPEIIFADEPSGNLDSENAEDLHKLFFTLRQELNQTFVIVTHNPNLAQMADRIIEIKDGVIVGSNQA